MTPSTQEGVSDPSDTATAAADLSEPTREVSGRGPRRYYALLLLAIAYGLHALDRSIVSVLIEPVKREFHLHDATIGVIAGMSHTVGFALASLPVGGLVDRTARVRLLILMLAAWSGLTAMCALAGSYMLLIALRFLVGAAEAGAAPACLSLIADLFARRERTTAVGLLYLSPALGTAASFLLGAAVADWLGWRAAFLIAGLPGMILALITLLTLDEPARTAPARADAPENAVAGIIRIAAMPAMRHLLVAVSLAALVMTSVWTWSASLLIRSHGLTILQAGAVVAVAAGICQAAGSAASGRWADHFARGAVDRLAKLAAVSVLAAVPLGMLAVLSRETAIAISALMALAFVFTGWIAPAYTIALDLAGASSGGIAIATVQLVTTLVGAGGGPYLVGLLSDRIGGPESLRLALAATICLNLWAAAHFWRLGVRVRRMPAN